MPEPGFDFEQAGRAAAFPDLRVPASPRPRVQPSPTPACPVPVDPPVCDCHQAEECPKERVVECAECGVNYERGTEHVCKAESDPILDSSDMVSTAAKYRRIERVAAKCVKHYGDFGDDDGFSVLMTDLAIALADG